MLHGKGGEPKQIFDIDYEALHPRVEVDQQPF